MRKALDLALPIAPPLDPDLDPAPERPLGVRPPAVALSVIAFGVIVAVLYLGRVFFITSIFAIIFAFILEPFVSFLTKARIPRSLGAFLVIGVAGLLLYLLSASAWREVSGLSEEMPHISDRLGTLVDGALDNVDSLEHATSVLFTRRSKIPEPPPLSRANRKRAVAASKSPLGQLPGVIPEVRIHEDHNPVTDYIYARLGTVYQYLLMASFVPFLVYFMLSWQEHLNRNFLQLFNAEARLTASRSLRGIARLVRAFVVGNFVLGILLAVFSSLAFWMMDLPYPMLAGPISGFLSLAPYIGLPLALVVPGFLSLGETGNVSQLALIFVVVMLLHVIALNVLYPKLVGARVHLNPLAVTFALMFWGFLWDAAGLLLAIPLTAGIKAVCDNVRVLQPYGRFLGD